MLGTTCWQTELADSKPVPCVEKHLYTKLRCVNMSLPSETPCFLGVFVESPQASQAECRGFDSLCPLSACVAVCDVLSPPLSLNALCFKAFYRLYRWQYIDILKRETE